MGRRAQNMVSASFACFIASLWFLSDVCAAEPHYITLHSFSFFFMEDDDFHLEKLFRIINAPSGGPE